MHSIFEKDYILTPEYCGASATLSPLGAFTVFQAMATLHADALGVGSTAMAQRGMLWVAVHTRVDFPAPARLMDEVTAQTWAEGCRARDVRSYRSYMLRRGDTDIARGKTEWAILGPGQKLVPFGQSGFPEDYAFPEQSAIADRPRRFHEKFEESERFARRTVRSTDIDLGHHMNNVAYVRALLDCFTADELADGRIRSVEIHYASPCFEGETLSIFKKQLTDGDYRLAVIKEDGKAAAQAAVSFSV